jgi:hypothetical protein
MSTNTSRPKLNDTSTVIIFDQAEEEQKLTPSVNTLEEISYFEMMSVVTFADDSQELSRSVDISSNNNKSRNNRLHSRQSRSRSPRAVSPRSPSPSKSRARSRSNSPRLNEKDDSKLPNFIFDTHIEHNEIDNNSWSKETKIYPNELSPDINHNERTVIDIIKDVRKKANKDESKVLSRTEANLLKRYFSLDTIYSNWL